MFGLSDSNWKTIQHLLITPLKNNGAQLWVFGSRARGDHKKYSDLDILVEWPKPDTESLKIIQKIKEDLEESNVPITVDLVNRKDLAQSYVAGVLKERVLI